MQVPFVARGAGTGLSGGALAEPDAVLITLTRLNRILSVDPMQRRAVLQPGVVNARLSEAVLPLGPPVRAGPSSQAACTVGGNVAENAGGPHCLKYGVTTNHIVALEVVLPDGRSPAGLIRASRGDPIWSGLFVGSEGMFGIATEITVRLEPIPESVRTMLADFPTVRGASEAVSSIIAAGIVPAALEMMDRACVRRWRRRSTPRGTPPMPRRFCWSNWTGRTRRWKPKPPRCASSCAREAHGKVRSASSPADRARLWQGRKKAFGAMGRIAPDLAVQDAVVPRSALPDIMDQIERIRRVHDLTISNVFHAGDGNLHPNISFDRRNPAVAARVRLACREIMAACVAAGGSITGEHGVGNDKLDYMAWIFTAETLGAMQAVRRAFDPSELANPGKSGPTPCLSGVVCREEPPSMSDAIFTRLRALLGTTGVERDADGVPRATPDTSDALTLVCRLAHEEGWKFG